MLFSVVLNCIIGVINIVAGFLFLYSDYPVLGFIWLIQAPFNFYIAGEDWHQYVNYEKKLAALRYKRQSNHYHI